MNQLENRNSHDFTLPILIYCKAFYFALDFEMLEFHNFQGFYNQYGAW